MLLITAAVAFALTSCTKFDDVRVGVDGAHAVQKIPVGMEIVNATWKDARLWVLVRKRTTAERADTLFFDCYEGFESDTSYSSRLILIEQ